MGLVRVLRPLVGILATVALAIFVVADHLGLAPRPLVLGPREWAPLIFSTQVTSMAIGRAFRLRRKARRGGPGSGAVAAEPRFTNLEFAEMCAIVLTVGYWFLTDARMDSMLAHGWRLVLVGILLAIPLVAKLVSDRTDP